MSAGTIGTHYFAEEGETPQMQQHQRIWVSSPVIHADWAYYEPQMKPKRKGPNLVYEVV